MTLQNWQRLLIGLCVLVGVIGAYALEAFDYSHYLSIASAAATPVFVFLWQFLHGKNTEQANQQLQQQGHAGFWSRLDRVKPACLIAFLVLVILGLLIWKSEAQVFVTDTEDEVAVYRKEEKGQEKLEGYTSKSKPFKKRYLSGKITFAFRADGYEPLELPVEVGHGPWLNQEKHHRLDLRTTAVFLLKSDYLSGGEEEAADANKYPQNLVGSPSHLLHFELASPSRTALQVSQIQLKASGCSPLTSWSFPFMGEAPGWGAPPVRGYAVLRPVPSQQVPIMSLASRKLGAKEETAHYIVRVFSEPGMRYEDLTLVVSWTDLHHPERAGTYEIPLQNAKNLNHRRDWRSVVKNKQHLRILYNCRVDRLEPELSRVGVKKPYHLMIADPNAARFFKDKGMDPPRTVPILPERLQRGIAQLLPSVSLGDDRTRFCSFFIVDGKRTLQQDSRNPYEGILVEDGDYTASLMQEFDRLYQSLRPR